MSIKKTILYATSIASITFAMATQAATPGPYFGVGIGFSALKTPDTFFNSEGAARYGEHSLEHTGIGGRGFGGYNLNQYFGLEAGYARYTSSKYKTVFKDLNASTEYSMNALDLVGKAYLPVSKNFNLYALGGVAEVRSTMKYRNASQILNQGSATTYRLRPKFGVGMNYNVTSHITTGIEYSRIKGLGNMKTSSRAIPDADMAGLTFTYNFD